MSTTPLPPGCSDPDGAAIIEDGLECRLDNRPRYQSQASATPEQAWERLREAILNQQTKPSTENALRIRRWSDALVAALNEGGAG